MPLVLYQYPGSAPCRAVLMTAEHLGLEMVTRHVDLMDWEQMKPEFLAVSELLILSNKIKSVYNLDLLSFLYVF